MKASKLTARGLAYVLRAVGRKIAKAHREAQTPHGKQSVKKLMAHGTATNSIEVDAPKVFDRVARKWNVDYAFYKTGPDKYLLFFKTGQADAMTACFSEYSRKVLDKSKSRRVPIREQLKRAADQLAKDKPRQKERVKEAAMRTDKIRKYVLPNIPYLFIGWACLKWGRLPSGRWCELRGKTAGAHADHRRGFCEFLAGA
mgnify:CR=1 FL=1